MLPSVPKVRRVSISWRVISISGISYQEGGVNGGYESFANSPISTGGQADEHVLASYQYIGYQESGDCVSGLGRIANSPVSTEGQTDEHVVASYQYIGYQ